MKKKFKVITLLLVILFIIVSIIPNSTKAVSSAVCTLSVSGQPKVSADVGDEFTVDLKLSNIPENKNTLGIKITYDSTKLQVIGDSGNSQYLSTSSGLVEDIIPDDCDSSMIYGSINNGEITIVYSTMTEFKTFNNVGTISLGSIKFKVLATGESNIQLSSVKLGFGYDSSLEESLASTNLNKILVNEQEQPEFPVGDVNGNGTVNSSDYRLVLRYVKGVGELTEDQLQRADVNGNGSVNSSDYRAILRYVKGITTSVN